MLMIAPRDASSFAVANANRSEGYESAYVSHEFTPFSLPMPEAPPVMAMTLPSILSK